MSNLMIPMGYIQMAAQHERDYDFALMLEYVSIAMMHHDMTHIARADYDAVIAEWHKPSPSHERLEIIFTLASNRQA